MKSDALKKHHFWLLFGAVPLLVGLLVIMMMSGPGDAIAVQNANYKKSADEVGAAKAGGTGLLVELGKQKDTLEERRGQLWGDNYERQKKEGVFAWPDAGRDKLLKDLEKLDLRFGAKAVDNIDAAKEADTQFVVLNDEMSKFTNSANYLESYNRLAASVLPTRFAGAGWTTVLRHVNNWGTGRPDSNLFWLALEDFWIQRALLKPIGEVNATAAKFELVKPAGADTPLKRKFQNRTWEIDIEVATEGPDRVLKSKLKNKTDRLQMLGLNKTMRLNVWFEDPKLSTTQPFEYRIGGELVKGSAELAPKVVPEIHKVATEPAEIYKIEQILDEITAPVRLVRRLELGYLDSKRSAAELKMPSFLPEEAAPATGADPAAVPPLGAPQRGDEADERPGFPGAATGRAGSKSGTAEQVLLGNKKRYIERTEQVRRMPVALGLVVDQAYVNDVLIAIGNSPLRIQITQTQWQRFRDPLAVSSNAAAGPPGGFRPGGDDEDPDRRGAPAPMFPGFSPPAAGGSTGALPQSQVTAGLVELAVYGIVSIYEKATPKSIDPNKPMEPMTEEPKPMDPMPKVELPNNPGVPPTGPAK